MATTPGEVESIERNFRALLATAEAAAVPEATVQNRAHSCDWVAIKGRHDFHFFKKESKFTCCYLNIRIYLNVL